MDNAPATSPATPATMTACVAAPDAATPSTRLEVDRIPSLAPSTAARSQFERRLRWRSPGRMVRVTGYQVTLHAHASRTPPPRGPGEAPAEGTDVRFSSRPPLDAR